EAVAAARQAGGAGRLREALWRWRIAEAVAPDAMASREAAAAQARLDAAVQSAEAEGARAASSGRTGEAQAAYMRALELDPGRPQARAFMRDALAAQTMADVGRLAGSTPRASEKRAHGGRRVKAARRRPGAKS
ncbi:MAG: hypothetical protein INR64_13025, partial [Caulobacteraceae bacterium]|nr:hypothetical protein [Caulobacter sp.]